VLMFLTRTTIAFAKPGMTPGFLWGVPQNENRRNRICKDTVESDDSGSRHWYLATRLRVATGRCSS
jgi:hypothetical protein